MVPPAFAPPPPSLRDFLPHFLGFDKLNHRKMEEARWGPGLGLRYNGLPRLSYGVARIINSRYKPLRERLVLEQVETWPQNHRRGFGCLSACLAPNGRSLNG